MFEAKVETKFKKDINAEIKKNLQDLANKKVVCGFPKGKLNAPHYQFRHGRGLKENPNPPSIIDVAIWNNYGIGVPRRDFMTPSSKRWAELCKEKVAEAGDDLLLGKINVKSFLLKLGGDGAEIIKEEIAKLDTPPNAPLTIALKGSENPLVDSGDMLNATTYELREKNE